MPRSYFHIHDGMSLPDKEGVELPDLEEAKDEAIKLAAEVLRDRYAGVVWNGTSWRLDVTDGSEQALLVWNFFASEPNQQPP